MEILCFAVIAAFLVDPIRAIDCSHNKCLLRGEQHPLCEYLNPNPSPECRKIVSIGLSSTEKDEILATHNQIRWYVSQGLELAGKPGPQPAAENMRIMVWDKVLAMTAQRWANQCQFSNAPCVDDDRFDVGQVIGWVKSPSPIINTKPSEIIYKLYNQVEQMDGRKVNYHEENSETAFYTQLVWADTNKIGCGKIIHQDTDDNYLYFLICLYGPKGNYAGKSVYEIA